MRLKKEDRRSFSEIPKLLASIFLLNADYYRAMVCLRDAIRIEPTDLKGGPSFARTSLLRLSLFLEEWELFRSFYEEEQQRGVEKYGEAFGYHIKCLYLVYLLHTEDEANRVSSLIFKLVSSETLKPFLMGYRNFNDDRAILDREFV